MSRKKRLLQAACEETVSRPYIEGRFVHVSELGAKLFCRPCKALYFSHGRHKKDSQEHALRFTHKVSCVCVPNKISTGKIHPGKSEKLFIPDINSRIFNGKTNTIAPNFYVSESSERSYERNLQKINHN